MFVCEYRFTPTSVCNQVKVGCVCRSAVGLYASLSKCVLLSDGLCLHLDFGVSSLLP